MSLETRLVPGDAVRKFRQEFGNMPVTDGIWRSILPIELRQLNDRNPLLSTLIKNMLYIGPQYLRTFDKTAYLKGALSIHRMLRFGTRYTSVTQQAIIEYTREMSFQLEKGRAEWLAWMELTMKNLAPGALDSIDPKLHIARFTVGEPEAVAPIHGPEILLGASDVSMPMAIMRGALILSPTGNPNRN